MKLKAKIIEKIRQTPEVKRELIYQLNISHGTFFRQLRENADENTFTTMKAVKIISAGLGVPESEILEE
ncbi:MAG: hypothetical protein LBN27_12105 [Prevotellaceae bacterium]|jgi:hypothetical protein|nr:hypothetical protein [Prevotellaceae bacterium]